MRDFIFVKVHYISWSGSEEQAEFILFDWITCNITAHKHVLGVDPSLVILSQTEEI